MASVRPNRPTIDLVCPVCKSKYIKEKYEHDRNVKKGRVNVCSRSCQATYMNGTDAKLESTRAMLAVRNADQYREKNANWKGGISVGGGHPLKPIPEEKK